MQSSCQVPIINIHTSGEGRQGKKGLGAVYPTTPHSATSSSLIQGGALRCTYLTCYQRMYRKHHNQQWKLVPACKLKRAISVAQTTCRDMHWCVRVRKKAASRRLVSWMTFWRGEYRGAEWVDLSSSPPDIFPSPPTP